MSHVDYNMGVYYPEGGIGAVVDGIVELGGTSASSSSPTPR